MINKIKIKPCASLPGQGVKMSNVSQNGGLHGTWWSWIFMWSKTLFKVYIWIIWTTVWYQILIFRILKLLDLQNIAQLKRKRKLIMGAEFVTFDNAVNTMPSILRRCGLNGCTQKLFMSFLLPADYRAKITVILLFPIWRKLLSKDIDFFRCPSFVTRLTNCQSDITTPKVKWNIFVFSCIVQVDLEMMCIW